MSESPTPDPGKTMDKGFIVGAVVGLIVLFTMSSIASCIRGEQDKEGTVEEQSQRFQKSTQP